MSARELHFSNECSLTGSLKIAIGVRVNGFLDWLVEPKSPEFRLSAGLGCLGATVLGGLLIFAVLFSAGLMHCIACDTSWVGRQLALSIALALSFGVCVGFVAAISRRLLLRALSGRTNLLILGLSTTLAAFLCHEPAYRFVERVEYRLSS